MRTKAMLMSETYMSLRSSGTPPLSKTSLTGVLMSMSPTSLVTSPRMRLSIKKLVVDKYPCHGQSIDRIVKQVTIAAKNVFGQEARDGYIRASVRSRKILTINNTKKDLIGIISESDSA